MGWHDSKELALYVDIMKYILYSQCSGQFYLLISLVSLCRDGVKSRPVLI